MTSHGKCRYVRYWVAVKARWHLNVTRAEKSRLASLASGGRNARFVVRKATSVSGSPATNTPSLRSSRPPTQTRATESVNTARPGPPAHPHGRGRTRCRVNQFDQTVDCPRSLYAEPMAEGEVSLTAKAGVPLVLPGLSAEVSGTFRQTWGRRQTDFTAVAAEAAAMSVEALGTRLIADERFRDLFWKGITRAVEVSEPEYREALARVVAGATDDARIDECAHLLAQLVRLEPLHLRVLTALIAFSDGDGHRAEPASATVASPSPARTQKLAERVGLSEAACSAAAHTLNAAGLIEDRDRTDAAGFVDDRDSNMGRPPTRVGQHPPIWHATAWAFKAVALMFPVTADDVAPS